ncbi:MAG: thymidylate synthase [Oscillospiraceae bacterium]|nr:thymidylate synthase [Oscillospiraceae bacterium]
MKEIFVSGKSLPEAYHSALKELYENGEIVDCPDYDQKQKECSMTVFVENPTSEPRISRLIIGGAHEIQQYEMELLDGILDFMIGADENVWEYTYHDRYKYQIPFILSELKRNAYSRRAVMNIRDFEIDSSNDDPACMQSIQYFIRDNKINKKPELHCKILFRSNDLPEAFFYNAFALIRLQERIAAELGIDVGTYTHRSNSMHCYEKDFDLIAGYIKGMNERSLDSLTYNYEEDFKEIMLEEIPSILKMVEEQKAKYKK